MKKNIKINILFGSYLNEDVELGLRKLIDHLNLKKFIESQSNGIDSIISEKGLNVSGGEMQRIAICRAMLKDPKIIILDEATSSLEPDNENEIIEYLDGLQDKTIISVSHKITSLKNCNKIYKFENKKLIQINKNEYF